MAALPPPRWARPRATASVPPMPTDTVLATPSSIPAWRLAAAGCAMLLLGIGLARFGYTPLIPPLVHAGWMSAPAAAFLGATNLAGYLLGAALARQLPGSTRPAVRVALLAATLSFFACAIRLGL